MYQLLLRLAFDDDLRSRGLDPNNTGADQMDALHAFEARVGDEIRRKPCFIGYFAGYCFHTSEH